MNDLKQRIEEAVRKESIDLIGFAPKSRFEGLDARLNPFTIFPEGKTVIMLGKRICRGSLRGIEEGTNFGDYGLFGRNWLEDEFLSLACYGLTSVLEDEGWEAVPVFPNPSELAPTGVPVREGQPAPNVFPDFTYAAVACGLCEIGRSGVLLSKQFGSRQRFQMIITDAELEATPLLETKVCDGCMKCADACPLGAISKDETRTITICGKEMTVAVVDYDKCRICKNGALPNRFTNKALPDRVPALCNRTCMCHLEENQLVGNLFENAFRQNPIWALDASGAWTGDSRVQDVQGGVFTRAQK